MNKMQKSECMKRPYILCVDDDITILMSLRAQLKYSFGDAFKYETAESASEAWEIIREVHEKHESIAVVISDWLMPETKGDKFLVDLHLEFPEIIKIMLTGHADETAVKRAMERAEMKARLTKPWDRIALERIIRENMETP